MAAAVDEERHRDIEEGYRDSEAWQGLPVRTRDGTVLGAVVGVFAEGLLAGRLLVQGDYPRGGYRARPQDGIAVYTIPRSAVVRRRQDCLLLGAPLSKARATWLMHVLRAVRPT
jgi:hypothetical protein